MIDDFLHGHPSIYDMATALLCVLILGVQLSFHVKQMRDARELAALRRFLKVSDVDLA